MQKISLSKFLDDMPEPEACQKSRVVQKLRHDELAYRCFEVGQDDGV